MTRREISAADPAAIARVLIDAWNNRDFERMIAVLAEDLEWINTATGSVLRGPHALRRMFQEWLMAMPDATAEVIHTLVDGEWVILECVGHGTHTGDITGSIGEIPASGRRLETPFCNIVHIRDGRIDRGRHYINLASMAPAARTTRR